MEKEQLVSLVISAQNGDKSATNQLFNEYYNDLYYFALKTVKDDELALDITQEAFVEIINTLGNLKEPAAFVTWAKQITYHQCTRYFKKKKDVLVDEDEDGNSVFDDIKEESAEFIPDEALDQSDFKKTILSILDELSEEQRSAVMMYYFDEMSVRQIAEIQGVSDGTVKSRLNYARKAIKASVEEYEKKNNIKLHAIPFFPFFKWLFKGSYSGAIPTATAQTIATGVTAATGTTVTVAAATTTTVAATTAATATAVGIGAKFAAIPLAIKIVAATVAAAVVVGGTTTAVIITNKKDGENESLDTSSVSSAIPVVNDNENVSDEKVQLTPVDELILEGTIPTGCTYTLTDGTVLTAGQSFPESCTAGDVVAYGDYLYGYECIYMGHEEDAEKDWHLWKDGFDSGDSGLIESDAFGTWSVMVADRTKSSYGMVVSKINGEPIKTLYATYYGCENMTNAPKIPNTITAMTATYYGCSSLETAPVIPSNVERMMMTFRECTSLEGNIIINATLDKSLTWYYADTFSGTTGKINLAGSTPEEDLILIAKASDNPNITVKGKKVEYETDVPSDDQGGADKPDDDSSDEQDGTERPDKGQPITLDEYVETKAQKYVSGKLLYSNLPHFSSVDEISMSNAFWFAFYGIDKEPYFVSEDEYGVRYYEIPVSVFTTEMKNIFGREYDLTGLYEYDATGTWQVGYTPVNGGEDVIVITLQGGGGTDYHPEITSISKLGDDKYQVNISWYSAAGEPPTDENAEYYYNESTGDYWIADRWDAMVLEAVNENVENKIYLRVRIVSYLAK